MILADKIILLRKRNGWSQEDLAGRLNVSRQAVAKWESTQSVPTLEKILQLSELFEVTTDYLLKDDSEEIAWAPAEDALPCIEMEQAHQFLQVNEASALPMACGVALCILSPVPLIFLGAASEYRFWKITEGTAGGLGLIALLVLVAAAVALFLWIDQRQKPWKFLEDGNFSLGYGVRGMVLQQKKLFSSRKTLLTIVGVVLCILSPIPIFAALFLKEEFLIACSVDLLLLLVAGGVFLLVYSCVISSGYDKLLQEEEYSEENRRQDKIMSPVASIYWILATVIYLAWSLPTEDWEHTWIVWPIAGVLFAAVACVVSLISERKKKEEQD